MGLLHEYTMHSDSLLRAGSGKKEKKRDLSRPQGRVRKRLSKVLPQPSVPMTCVQV